MWENFRITILRPRMVRISPPCVPLFFAFFPPRASVAAGIEASTSEAK